MITAIGASLVMAASGATALLSCPVAFGEREAATGLVMGRDWALTSWIRPLHTGE
jgi:hypothetical protein